MINTLDARQWSTEATSDTNPPAGDPRETDIVIVGAGIAGLGAAHRLDSMGRSVLVLEEADRVGGSIVTLSDSGRLIERGPSSYLSSGAEMVELVKSLGLEGETIEVPLREAKRYIYADDRVQPVPSGPGSFFGTGLLSWSGKLRLLSEPFRGPGKPVDDESLESFVERRVGKEAVARLLYPMVSGVYAGDPGKLSASSVAGKLVNLEKEYGGIVRGFIKSRKRKKDGAEQSPKKRIPKAICTVRDGLSRIPEKIVEQLGERVCTRTRVVSVKRDAVSGKFLLETAGKSGERRAISAKAVLIATPVTGAVKLLQASASRVSVCLEQIPTNQVGVVTTVYRREDVRHTLDGFGFLVARGENLRILGSLWYSSIFPENGPDGEVILNQFVGGARFAERLQQSDEVIVEQVREDLRGALETTADPIAEYLTRWSPAIAQPPVGHPQLVEEIERELETVPGLALAGNYLCGISMNDSLASGLKAADRVEAYVGTSSDKA